MPLAAEIALSETVRRLTEQTTTLNQIRTSAGAVVSAGTVGTAFLAGIALEGHEGMPGLGWLALTFVALATVCALWALFPLELGVVTDPDIMAKDEWASLESGAASLAIARYLAKRATANAKKLDERWCILRAASICTAASIGLWIALIATR